jgi:hypothetical protein
MRSAFVAGLWLASVLGVSGCGESIYAGSEILWSARHETADLSEWSSDGLGGEQVQSADDSVSASSDYAHTGIYSAKFVRALDEGSQRNGGPILARLDGLPEQAYYSAWFLIPESHTTISYWTIFKFDPTSSDQDVWDRGVDLQLRSVPFGGYVLEVLFHNEAYLRAPLANPPPEIAVGRWFQVEVEFRAATDTSGRCVVWLDGRRVYDLLERPTISAESVGFMVANLLGDVRPGPVVMYMDDAVISRVRATPEGRLVR